MSPGFIYEDELAPDDILAGIFLKAWERGKSDHFTFRSHLSELQRIFFKLQQDFPLLKTIVYSSRGPEPYSPMLEEALSRMQLAGLIGRENPEYQIVRVKESLRPYFQSYVSEKFSETMIEQLDRIAEEFLSEVNASDES